MKRLYIMLWYVSIALFVLSIIPFIDFMYHTNFSTMRILIILIAAAVLCYVISTKLITYPKGYTAVQAMRFYKACKKEDIGKPEQCKKHSVKFKQIASRFDFAKNFEQEDLIEIFETGYELLNRKENK